MIRFLRDIAYRSLLRAARAADVATFWLVDLAEWFHDVAMRVRGSVGDPDTPEMRAIKQHLFKANEIIEGLPYIAADKENFVFRTNLPPQCWLP